MTPSCGAKRTSQLNVTSWLYLFNQHSYKRTLLLPRVCPGSNYVGKCLSKLVSDSFLKCLFCVVVRLLVNACCCCITLCFSIPSKDMGNVSACHGTSWPAFPVQLWLGWVRVDLGMTWPDTGVLTWFLCNMWCYRNHEFSDNWGYLLRMFARFVLNEFLQ